MTRIAIDLNVRVRGSLTYSGFEDVHGVLPEDGPVEVFESESGLTGRGWVTEVDHEARLVYLKVDWASLKERSPFVVTAGGNAAGPNAGFERYVPVDARLVLRVAQAVPVAS